MRIGDRYQLSRSSVPLLLHGPARRTEAARRAAEGRWSQPCAREAQSARAIATLAAMSPEQKAEWGGRSRPPPPPLRGRSMGPEGRSR